MTDRQVFNKKLIYLGLLVPLLLVLYALGRPESTDARGKTQGGVLAQMRLKYKLSQSNLGEVDPVSESFKLATLGLRPVAVVLLWEKCNYYKKVEDWSNFEAALTQITNLEPNFIKVWDYQSHNLSFNISAELDDWRDRYYYVIKGLKFLIKGTHANTNDSLLLNRIGWFIAQKIGRSDEKVLYRRRFAQDDELHDYLNLELDRAAGIDVTEEKGDQADPQKPSPTARRRDRNQRDSWLVSREWYRQAEDAVDWHESQIRGESRVIFYSHGPLSQISYARSLEDEGWFDDLDKIRAAWRDAQADWTALATRDFASYEAWHFRLIDQEDYEKRSQMKRQELDELVGPEVRARLRAARFNKLSPAEQVAVNKPWHLRTASEHGEAAQAEAKLEVADRDVALDAPPDKRRAAERLADQAFEFADRAQKIGFFRDHVNFNYWRLKCDAERDEIFLDARRLTHQARREQKDSSLTDETKRLFEDALLKWRVVINTYPKLFVEAVNTDDIYEFIQDYHKLLRDRGETFPDKFVLQDILDQHEKR